MRPAVGQYAAVFYGQELRGAIGFAILPVCIAVAVLKYRLYSIDRIISRVVAYAVITAVLAGVFTGPGAAGHRSAALQDAGGGGGRRDR